MYCSYHPSNPSRAQCASCARRLCTSCDHRIKGYPYCQDCIVLGIETLSRTYGAGRSRGRARLAAVLALIPGLGAVYNRQNTKAVVHFVTTVVLFQLSSISALEGMFALAGTVFYIYSIIDAYRTAQFVSEGGSAAEDEARFKRRLVGRAPAIGIALICAGLLSVIQVLRPFGLAVSLVQILPVALIILGGYLLTSYFKRSKEEAYSNDYSSRPPYSLIQGAATGGDAYGRHRHAHPGDKR